MEDGVFCSSCTQGNSVSYRWQTLSFLKSQRPKAARQKAVGDCVSTIIEILERGLMLKLLNSKPGLTRQHLQIIACAGSGKTEFVSLRIAHLIAERLAKPENIVAFTFTERAAQELKFRIRSKNQAANWTSARHWRSLRRHYPQFLL